MSIQTYSSIVEKSSVVERPFYFVVVFWGETFCNYLVHYCLASLLAPGNIPILGEGKHRFIFCTTQPDWQKLSSTKIFVRLKEYIEPYFIEIPPAPAGKSGCEHMGIGHKLATQLIHQDGAYGIFLTPDMMVSDGTISALQRHARAGVKVVLVAALRFGEEPLFERLRAMGARVDNGDILESGTPLVLTSRQLVSACLQSFHSETLQYEWDAPYFTSFPSACWWRVGGEDGIVVHSLSWAPFLFDYSEIEKHDTRALDTWTMDGDYVYQNFGDDSNIHVVTDSDEMMLVSWAPLADRPQSLVPNPFKMLPVVGDLVKGGTLRASLLSGMFDPLKHRLFFKPVRWHTKDLTSAWKETQKRATKVLRRYAWNLDPSSIYDVHWGWRAFMVPWTVLGRIWIVMAHLCQYRLRIALRLREGLQGDKDAWFRMASRTGTMMRWILGVKVKP